MKIVALLALCGAFLSTVVIAAGVESGVVTHLLVHWPGSGSGKFDVALSGTVSGSSCASGEWTGYLNNEAGRAQYALLLSAHSQNKEVVIEGNTTCDANREVIRNVSFAP